MPFWARRMYCFLLYLSSDLGGVWLFRRSCIFALVQARLRHVFGLLMGLFSSPKGVPKVTRRTYCFLLYLSSDLGGVWLFRLRCRRASLQSSESASCMVLFSSMVLLLQLFLSVVVRFDAGRGLVDDPTSLGTRFSIWRLVRALYPATFLTRLNLLATFGACVGEAARDDTASDSKLLVTMAGRLHVSRLHGTVDCDMAIYGHSYSSRLFALPLLLHALVASYSCPWLRSASSTLGASVASAWMCFCGSHICAGALLRPVGLAPIVFAPFALSSPCARNYGFQRHE